MTRRGGATLAELLVATAVGLMVMAAALVMWTLAGRARTATEHADALAAAAAIEDRITADVRRLVVVEAAPVFQTAPDRIGFHVWDPLAPAEPRETLPVRAVVYAPAGQPAMLRRTCAGQSEAVGSMPLTSIRFSPMLGPRGGLLRVSVVLAPAGAVARPIAHAFLVRLPEGAPPPATSYRILSGFADPADHPAMQPQPTPPVVAAVPGP